MSDKGIGFDEIQRQLGRERVDRREDATGLPRGAIALPQHDVPGHTTSRAFRLALSTVDPRAVQHRADGPRQVMALED
jgi:hypothetical protein